MRTEYSTVRNEMSKDFSDNNNNIYVVRHPRGGWRHRGSRLSVACMSVVHLGSVQRFQENSRLLSEALSFLLIRRSGGSTGGVNRRSRSTERRTCWKTRCVHDAAGAAQLNIIENPTETNFHERDGPVVPGMSLTAPRWKMLSALL
jgi:hypothetical protein